MFKPIKSLAPISVDRLGWSVIAVVAELYKMQLASDYLIFQTFSKDLSRTQAVSHDNLHPDTMSYHIWSYRGRLLVKVFGVDFLADDLGPDVVLLGQAQSHLLQYKLYLLLLFHRPKGLHL